MVCDLKGEYKLELRGTIRDQWPLKSIVTYCQDCMASHTRRLNIHCCENVRLCVLWLLSPFS